jgi:integrase
MAISKRSYGHFQARVVGANGKIHCATFPSRREAQNQELKWKQEKRNGLLGSSAERKLTVREFFHEWHQDVTHESLKETRSGWRETQNQYFRDYIEPVLGNCPLKAVTPQMIKKVLIEMARKDRSAQTQRLVYATMKKMFADAVETYQYMGFNPVLRKIKPAIFIKEAPHLNLKQIISLLEHVKGKKYELAIWIQLYLGLRAGELIALRWEDIDLEVGRITIRRAFVKKTGQFRDYPKGGKQHTHSIPAELLVMLIEAKRESKSELVVTSRCGGGTKILPYRWYIRALRKYCHELGITSISSHGLRHSTSELYIHHGATKDDLRQLFAHSSPAITDRYIHNHGTNLEKVANVIRLFPNGSDPKMTPRSISSDSQISK